MGSGAGIGSKSSIAALHELLSNLQGLYYEKRLVRISSSEHTYIAI